MTKKKENEMKIDTLTSIRIEMTLPEAIDIITDPSDFISRLQDMLPAAQPRPTQKAAAEEQRLDGRSQPHPRTRCDVCGKLVSIHRIKSHAEGHAHAKEAG